MPQHILLACFGCGLFWPELLRPESFKLVELFGLIGEMANNNRTNELQCSFFVFFKDRKELSSECRCKTRFLCAKLIFFSNLVKVIGFRDFFIGGGGSDNVIVSDRFRSENFLNPVHDHFNFLYKSNKDGYL